MPFDSNGYYTSDVGVPGIDYQPIAPSSGSFDAGGRYVPGAPSRSTAPDPADITTIQQAQDDYQREADLAQTKQQEAEKSAGGVPTWMKAVSLLGKAYEYSSGSTYTRKLPVIGDIQRAAEDLPYVGSYIKTGLQVATNPLTYIPVAGEIGAGGDIAGAAALALAQNEAMGMGQQAAQQAGEAYQSAGLPGGKYAPTIGSLVGIAAGGKVAGSVERGGLKNLPGIGGFVPDALGDVGMNTEAKAKAVAARLEELQNAAVEAGHPTVGMVLHSNDDGLTGIVAPPINVTNTETLDPNVDLGDPQKLLADPVNSAPDPRFVYATVSKQQAAEIAAKGRIAAGSNTYANLQDITQTGDTVVRIPSQYTQIDPATGYSVLKHDVTIGDVQIYSSSKADGDQSWKDIAGLLGHDKKPWTKITVTTPEEAAKWSWDGNRWNYGKTPEEAAAQQAAAAQAGYGTHTGVTLPPREPPALGQQEFNLRGADLTAPPPPRPPAPPTAELTPREPVPPEAQPYQPKIPGLDRFAPPPPPEGMRGVLNPRGRPARTAVERGPTIFEQRSHPILQQIIANTIDKTVEGGGGSSTNVLGENMRSGFGLSEHPERTLTIPEAQFERSPATAIGGFYNRNKDLLHDPNNFLGTWHDIPNHVYDLDVSVNIKDRDAAFASMVAHNQQAMAEIHPDGTVSIVANPHYVKQGADVAAAAGSVAAENAPAPAPSGQRMTLTHYGPKELSEIDPAFQGQGIPSEELKRAGVNPNEAARFQSYYEENARPEKFFVDPQTGVQRGGMVKHTVEGDFNVLDLNSDEGRAFRAGIGKKDLDSALVEAGYDGYKVGDAGTVRLFGKRQVSAVNGVPVERAAGGTAAEHAPTGDVQTNIVKEVPQGNSTLQIASDGSAVDVAFAPGKKGAATTPEEVGSSAPGSVTQRAMRDIESDWTKQNPRGRATDFEVNPRGRGTSGTYGTEPMDIGVLTEHDRRFIGLTRRELANVFGSKDPYGTLTRNQLRSIGFQDTYNDANWFDRLKAGDITGYDAEGRRVPSTKIPWRKTVTRGAAPAPKKGEPIEAEFTRVGEQPPTTRALALNNATPDGVPLLTKKALPDFFNGQGTKWTHGTPWGDVGNGYEVRILTSKFGSGVYDTRVWVRKASQVDSDGVVLSGGGLNAQTRNAKEVVNDIDRLAGGVRSGHVGDLVRNNAHNLDQRLDAVADKAGLNARMKVLGEPGTFDERLKKLNNLAEGGDTIEGTAREVASESRQLRNPRARTATSEQTPDLAASSTWMRPDGTFVQDAIGNPSHSSLAAREGFNNGVNDHAEFGGATREASDAGYVRVRAWNQGGALTDRYKRNAVSQLGIAGNDDANIQRAAKAYLDAGVPADTPVRVDGPKGSRFSKTADDEAGLLSGKVVPDTLGEVAGGGTSQVAQMRSQLRDLPDPERNVRGREVNGVEQNPVSPEDIVGTREKEVDDFLNSVANRQPANASVKDFSMDEVVAKSEAAKNRPNEYYFRRLNSRTKDGRGALIQGQREQFVSELRNRAANGNEEARGWLEQHHLESMPKDWNAPVPAGDRPNWVAQILEGKSTPDAYGRTGLTIDNPFAPRALASETFGERGDESEKAGKQLLMSLFEDESINPAARMATHGMLYGTGARNEAGNFLPDTVKKLAADGKVLNGAVGTKSVQDILGKMAAADFLLHGNMDEAAWERFGNMAKDQFGVDLKQAVNATGVQAGKGETLEDFVKLRSMHYIDSMLMKPRYNGDLANMKRLTGLILSADPVHGGPWYEGTLPAAYELFGEDDGNTFLKFLAVTSQQKSPRDNLQLALDAFSDYKLGYFKDPEYVSYGVQGDIMKRLRYVAEGGEPTGMKINAFHSALTLDDYNAPVDRWMFRIFGYDDAKVASDKNVHEIIAQQMRLMGDELGMPTREVQAAIWNAARRESTGGNIVNEPYEELLLGGGKYSDTGQLLPDMESGKGLPTAKETLQKILDMRDKGVIDLPKDTQAAQLKAQQLIDETRAVKAGKVEVSLEQARSLAQQKGVPFTADDTAAQILDHVNEHPATGPRFSAADEDYDQQIAQAKQMSFAGMEKNPSEVADYDPTRMAQRSAELDTWANAGHLNHPTLPDDLKEVRDGFKQRIDGYSFEKKGETVTVPPMSDREIAVRYQQDARTADWQKQLLEEAHPDAVKMEIPAEGAAARELAAGRPGPRIVEGAGKLDALKTDLRNAGLADDEVNAIADKYRPELGLSDIRPKPVEPPTDAGEAIRAKSRADALTASPQSTEAYLRQRAVDAPTVNGRPVVATTDRDVRNSLVDISGNTAAQARVSALKTANDTIEKTIADAPWAKAVDQQFADSVDFSVGILERTPYRVGGTGPKAGGLYYKPDEIAVYNDVAAAGGQQLARGETTIHLNPVDLYEQARLTARVTGVPIHEALANETLETALHETAHDLAYHTPAAWANKGIPKDQQFLNVLNEMKANGADAIEAQRTRLVSTFKGMDEDGTLVKWENDNARIRRLHRDARDTGLQQSNTVGAAPHGNAEDVPLQTAARGGRGEGVPASDTGRGGEPGAGVSAGSADLAAGEQRAGLPDRGTARRVERTDLNGAGGGNGKPPTDTGTGTPSPEGEPRAAGERITTPAPRVLEKAGTPEQTKVFESPPKERILSPGKPLDQTVEDAFKDNTMRRLAARASNNPLLKRVVEMGGGKAATAASQLDRDMVGYAIKGVADESRVATMMAEVKQAKDPFVRLDNNLTELKDWRGKDVTVPRGDVYSHPDNFQLNAAQKGYVARIHQMLDEATSEAKAAGVDFKELGIPEGSHWIPRWVIGADDIELSGGYGRQGLGSKQPFQRPRQYRTEAEAIQNGVRYNDTNTAVENAIKKLLKATRDKEIIDAIKPLGRTPAELAGSAARAPLDAVGAKLTAARKEMNAANRVVDSLEKKNIATQAGRKTLSPADIRSQISDDQAVKDATSALADAKKTAADAQRSYDAAKTPKAQERLGAQNELARAKVTNATSDLKDATKAARARITGADQADVTGAKTVARTSLKAAQADAKAAQGRYEDLLGEKRSVASDYRQIVNTKAASFRESGMKFGLGADIIPVTRANNVPALGGRIFPKDVMDVLEKGMGIGQKTGLGLKYATNVNDLARIFMTSTDFGATMLQGLPVLGYSPRIWAKAAMMHLRTFFDPRVLERYYANIPPDVMKFVNDEVGGISNNFFSANLLDSEAGTIFQRAAKSTNPLLSVPGGLTQRFNVAFDGYADVAKVELAKALMPTAHNAQELAEVGSAIRNMTGTTLTARLGVGTTQRQVESLLMFSPRFTRAAFALAAQAFQAGPAGAAARRAVGGLIFGAMAFYMGIKYAMHSENPDNEAFHWSDFDPRSSRFMAIKVGDNYIGLGGSVRGMIQMLGGAAADAVTGHAGRLVSTESVGADANPFLKFIRGRSSPVASQGWTAATHEDPLGQQSVGLHDWLKTMPSEFIPFGVKSAMEANGGLGSKAAIYGAQTIGLPASPESASHSLDTNLKNDLKKIPTNVPGFSQDERDEITAWSDLTKFQKQQVLQRFPELKKDLNAKEQQFSSGYTQAQNDALDAKRALGQRLLTTWQKIQNKQPLTTSDLTPLQYRKELKDIITKQGAADASASGANTQTGLGGQDIQRGSPTHRQQVMDDYYKNVNRQDYTDPATGQPDFNKYDELQGKYLATLTQADRNIISQEQGAEYDTVAREFKADKQNLLGYWRLNDVVAQKMGFPNADAVAVAGSAIQQKNFAKKETAMKDAYRKARPDVDALLVKWGYVSKGINDRTPKKGSGSGILKSPLGSPLGKSVLRSPL